METKIDTEVIEFIQGLSSEERTKILEILTKSHERKQLTQKKKCKYEYSTVPMHYNFTCLLCYKQYREIHSFDILSEETPKDHYEKSILKLTCSYCEEELMKLSHKELVHRIMTYTDKSFYKT